MPSLCLRSSLKWKLDDSSLRCNLSHTPSHFLTTRHKMYTYYNNALSIRNFFDEIVTCDNVFSTFVEACNVEMVLFNNQKSEKELTQKSS